MTSKQSEMSAGAIIGFMVALFLILAALDFVADYKAEHKPHYYLGGAE